MTSTTLSSKEFKTLFKWAFRRNRTIMIIFSVLLGIGLVLDLYSMTLSFGGSGSEVAPVTICVFEVMAAFFTYISSLKTFSYLHNKRSVDMFGSLPVTRPTLMISHLLAGITSVAIPFTAGSLLAMGITAFSGEYFTDCVFMIFTTLLMIVSGYTFTALVAHCCGTIVDTAIVTFLSNCIWCGIIALYFGMVTEMIPGTDFESVIYTPLLTAAAPYAFSVMDLVFFENTNETTIIASIVWQLLLTAGIFMLAVYVSKKRKAESSQNGFAFPWLPMVIKAGASVVAGAFIGFVAAETSYRGFSNMYVFAFWYVIISAVAFVILHLIFARGFKGKFLSSAIVYVCTTAAAIGFIFVMTTGVGIDTYVPAPSTIKSVEFNYTEFKEPENIEIITEIHQIIADSIREVEEYPYYIGYYNNDDYTYAIDDVSEYKSYDEYAYDGTYKSNELTSRTLYRYVDDASFDFIYNRKVGFKTSRSYYISGYFPSTKMKKGYYDLERLDELLETLYSSEEYKRACYPELFDENALDEYEVPTAVLTYYVYLGDEYDYTWGYSYDNTSVGRADLPTDDDFIRGLCAALRKDILADQHFAKSPSVTYDMTSGDEIIKLDLRIRKLGRVRYDSDSSTSKYFTVKKTYSNTLEYLDEHHIEKQKVNYDILTDFDSDYIDFGMTGSYRYLRDHVKASAETMLEDAWVKVNGYWNYDEIHKYYDEYLSRLLSETSKLYSTYYPSDEDYFANIYDPDYENDYMRITGTYPEYMQLEDIIITDLEAFSEDYVESLGSSADTEKDPTSAGDISSDSDNIVSDNGSEIEGTTDSDISSDSDNKNTVSASDQKTSSGELI